MVDYQYTYLLQALLFLIVWLSLFLWRKDARKEMLILSSIFMVIGPITELIYTIDWWSPNFLFGFSKIGVEDFLFGFACGGISAVIYEIIFKKKIKLKKEKKNDKQIKNIRFITLAILAVTLFFIPTIFMGINSLYATIIALGIPILIIWFKRKDLILNSILSGMLLLLVASIVGTILEFLTPGWINAFYHFTNTPHIILFNIALDDLIWYFLAGAFIGPLYEYWQEGKLVKN